MSHKAWQDQSLSVCPLSTASTVKTGIWGIRFFRVVAQHESIDCKAAPCYSLVMSHHVIRPAPSLNALPHCPSPSLSSSLAHFDLYYLICNLSLLPKVRGEEGGGERIQRTNWRRKEDRGWRREEQRRQWKTERTERLRLWPHVHTVSFFVDHFQWCPNVQRTKRRAMKMCPNASVW